MRHPDEQGMRGSASDHTHRACPKGTVPLMGPGSRLRTNGIIAIPRSRTREGGLSTLIQITQVNFTALTKHKTAFGATLLLLYNY